LILPCASRSRGINSHGKESVKRSSRTAPIYQEDGLNADKGESAKSAVDSSQIRAISFIAMPLRIPEQHVPALAAICKLSDESVEQLITALSSTSTEPRPEDMAARIAEHVPSITPETLVEIIRIIYTIYGVREFSESEPEEFLDDLMDGIFRSELSPRPSGPAICSDDEPRIRERFQRLLGIESLSMLSKAIILQRDGERLYCESKILSDMRPVFGAENVGRPLAAVVTHTLKIAYHEGRAHKEFFVVLDRADLESLQADITRAQEKDRELRAMLKQSNIPDLGV
jgi:hypothetical protein